jgi:RimJ/RimL family protein N-acetyltransferase
MISLPTESRFVSPHEPDPRTGLPVGPLLANPSPARWPAPVTLEGRYCRLEPLDPVRHGDDLFVAATPPDAVARFTYLSIDPPSGRAEFDAWLTGAVGDAERAYFAVVDARTGRAEGRQAYMRIDSPNQSIEIGDIYWGPAISRTRISTEANFLFARHAFDDLGYRRYEWKCNSLNEPSRRAAERFGFTYEGTFRRNMITKGRTRDTAWYSIIDDEWPQIKAAYEEWLDPSNFDEAGQQRSRLTTARHHGPSSTRLITGNASTAAQREWEPAHGDTSNPE